jgi:hypothetical protein
MFRRDMIRERVSVYTRVDHMVRVNSVIEHRLRALMCSRNVGILRVPAQVVRNGLPVIGGLDLHMRDGVPIRRSLRDVPAWLVERVGKLSVCRARCH